MSEILRCCYSYSNVKDYFYTALSGRFVHKGTLAFLMVGVSLKNTTEVF